MLVETFLRGLVVVRANLEGGIDAHFFRFLGQVDGLGRGVSACSCDDLHPAGIVLDCDANNLEVLLRADRWGFSGGSDWDDAGNPCGRLAINECAEGVVIDGAIAKGSDECGMSACEHAGLLADFSAGGKDGMSLGRRFCSFFPLWRDDAEVGEV